MSIYSDMNIYCEEEEIRRDEHKYSEMDLGYIEDDIIENGDLGDDFDSVWNCRD